MDIPFYVQSGGHSLTTSTQVTQNAIQINMRRLTYIHIDDVTGIATVGGGTLTGEFANVTHAHGREVSKSPHESNSLVQVDAEIADFSRAAVGSCPCTGVMGIGLGAGIGMSSLHSSSPTSLSNQDRPPPGHVRLLHGQHSRAYHGHVRWNCQEDFSDGKQRPLVGR